MRAFCAHFNGFKTDSERKWKVDCGQNQALNCAASVVFRIIVSISGFSEGVRESMLQASSEFTRMNCIQADDRWSRSDHATLIVIQLHVYVE